MEIFNLRHAGAIELAVDGRPVSRIETRKRGLLVIGRALLNERAADDRAGRKHRKLSMDEMHALNEAHAADLRAVRG